MSGAVAELATNGFAAFKSSKPAQSVFRGLGLADYLEAAANWNELRHLIMLWNDPEKGRFVDRARHYDGACSSGERVLLHAILYVVDFAWLADELDRGRTWRRMHNVQGEFRRVVALCIAEGLT